MPAKSAAYIDTLAPSSLKWSQQQCTVCLKVWGGARLQKTHVLLLLPAIGTLYQIGDTFGCGDKKSSMKAFPLWHFEPSQRPG
jgi:hypothetical protein